MELRCLGDIAKVVSGTNIVRMSEKELDQRYTNEDFEYDFYHMKQAAGEIKVVYRQQPPVGAEHALATILSSQSKDKIISQAFVVMMPHPLILDPLYLCYLINESEGIARQFASFLQGSVVTRMPASKLMELQIPVIEREEQQKIGRLYATALYQNYLERRKADVKLQGILHLLHEQEHQEGEMKK